MPRPSWSGAISFGMVSIPIKLVAAVRRRTVSFNQLDRESMSRVRYKKVADATGEEVPSDQIAKGVDMGGGNYVIVDDDELAALTPERSRELTIEAFVPAEEIDPLLFDSSYHVVPDANAKPYALLAQSLAGTGKVGVGRFVMRQREHLALVRSVGDRLLVSTIVFPDEVVDPASIDDFEALEEVELNSRELEMASELVETMSASFDPSQYDDEYRQAVEELITQKAAGQVPVTDGASAPSAQVIDLAEALEASLRDAQAAKGRHPSSRGGEAKSEASGSKAQGRSKATKKKAAAKDSGKGSGRQRTRKSA